MVIVQSQFRTQDIVLPFQGDRVHEARAPGCLFAPSGRKTYARLRNPYATVLRLVTRYANSVSSAATK